MEQTNDQAILPLTQEDFMAIVKQANAGDPDALAELRRILDENPVVWQGVGDLGRISQMSLIRAIASGNQLSAESLERKVRDMQAAIAGPSPSQLEELAVQQVVVCWLETHYANLAYVGPRTDNLKEAKFRMQIKQCAQRRFESAIKSFCQVRKLMLSTATAGKPAPHEQSGQAQPAPCAPHGVESGNNGRCNGPVAIGLSNRMSGLLNAASSNGNGHASRLTAFMDSSAGAFGREESAGELVASAN